MPRHLIAVFRKFFLLSDHRDTGADTQLQNYIWWYEWAARTGWFITMAFVGLGLGPKGKLVEQVLKTIQTSSLSDLWTNLSSLAVSMLSNPAAVLLAVLTVGWHNAYLRHVKNETKIVESCFEEDQKPEWDEVSGAKFAPFIGAWLFLAFTGLCVLVGHVKWYALVAILLNLGDFAGNEFTKNNLLKAFRSKQFRTKDRVLLARRQIALEYWSEKWQFTRILMMFLLNVLALSVATDLFAIHFPDIAAYALVTIGIVVNEYIITNWRIERDQALKKYPVPGDEAGEPADRPKAGRRAPRKKRSAAQPDSGQ